MGETMGGTRSTEGVRRARTDPAPVGVLNPQELESSLRTLVQGKQVWSLKRPFSWCHFPGQSSQVRWRMLMIQHPNYIVSSLASLIVPGYCFLWKIRISFFAKQVFSDNVLKYENIFLGLSWRDQKSKNIFEVFKMWQRTAFITSWFITCRIAEF